MFSPICFPNFVQEYFSVWAVEKENKFLIGPKQYFFLSFLVEKEIITNIRKKIVNSEFEIGETIWWADQKISKK